MNARDFIYGGESLSSYGCMIVSFDSGSSMNAIEADSQRSFENARLFNGKYQPFVSTTYNDCVKMTFEVVKDPDTQSEKEFTQGEIRMIKRWLNSAVAKPLSLVDEDLMDVYWEGTFNVSDMYFSGRPFALSLEFQSNRPFALQKTRAYTGTLGAGESFTIKDTSDEIGFVYPTLEITCQSAGTLDLLNSYDGRHTIIENCGLNETITFSPLLQIKTTDATHEIYNDFNYRFLRIGNSYNERDNTITTTLPIKYTLSYNPIAKVVAG